MSLSKIIDKDFKDGDKPIIIKANNVKLGIHIYTNTSRKDILEKYIQKLSKCKSGNNSNFNNNSNSKDIKSSGDKSVSGDKSLLFKIGNYKFYAKDINFLKMKESQMEDRYLPIKD